MGTSFEEYLREAQRVLVPGGRLVIAEVRSRFEGEGVMGDPDDDGGDGDGAVGGLPAFLRLLKDVGFDIKHQVGPCVRRVHALVRLHPRA